MTRIALVTGGSNTYILFVFASINFTDCGQKTVKQEKIKSETSKQAISKINKMDNSTNQTILIPVKTLIEAMEAQNASLIRLQFAKTATQAYGANGTMKSPEETAKWLETDIISRQGKVANPEYTILNGNQVVVKGQYSSRGYSNAADFLFTIENSLITSWRMRY
ncbi:MAG: nuclear transport factor 2 family protein [Cytophagia bacterium]|nr:MAG: nuclear transport factor 2 family protein [Cytophagia bacterium]